MPVLVDDHDDERIADFVGLRDHDLRVRGDRAAARHGAQRWEHGRFVAEGDIVVARALSAGFRPVSALVDATRTAPLPPGLEVAPVYCAAPAVLERITGLGVHRGVLACFARRRLPSPDELLARTRRVVVLERVVNPTNIGLIARSARALGMDALLLDDSSADPLYRRAARVSMGEVYALEHARVGPLPGGLAPVRAAGFRIVALTPDPAAVALDEVRPGPADRVALLLGTEGLGLADASLAVADVRARIPMHHGVDSLNVGVAAGIACFLLGR
jgi:tRNA G18 (ribose-2'-O)-methylase SpoU